MTRPPSSGRVLWVKEEKERERGIRKNIYEHYLPPVLRAQERKKKQTVSLYKSLYVYKIQKGEETRKFYIQTLITGAYEGLYVNLPFFLLFRTNLP